MIGAIYRKELRARVVALAGLPLLALGLALVLWQLQREMFQSYTDSQFLLHPAYQTASFVACAAAGLVLGMWMVLAETPQAMWAFVRHRPASARLLFLGKLLAALTLYTAITVPPLIGSIWWATTHLPAPWLWAMAIPPLLDYLSGTVFVLAGMPVAAREARWFGSRLLPIGLAIFFTISTWAPWLWLALVGLLCGWLILLPASVSALASRSLESTQHWALRVLTAITLLPAVFSIPAAAFGLLSEQFRKEYRGTSQSYTLADGCVYQVTAQSNSRRDRLIVDAEGQRVADAPEENYDPAKRQFLAYNMLTLNWAKAGYGNSDRSLRIAQSYFGTIRQSMNEWWYFVYDWGCFVGYTMQKDQRPVLIGYMGANGFAEDRSQIQPFHPIGPRDYATGLRMVEASRVTTVNLNTRQTSTDFAVPAGEQAQAFGYISRRQANGQFTSYASVVTTDKAIHIYGPSNTFNLRVPDPEGYYIADVSADPNDAFFAILYRRSVKWEDMSKPLLLVRVDRTGKELTHLELPPMPSTYYDPGPVSHTLEAIGVPQAAIFPQIVRSLSHGNIDSAQIASLITALLCAIIAHLVLRSYSLPRRWHLFWVAIALLMGIGGLLLMFAVRQWPARVACPSCNRKRLSTREHCGHCGASFPVPDPGSIGIFDRGPEPAHITPGG